MFNIISDTHIEMYFKVMIADEERYDYYMGNLEALSSKIQKAIKENVGKYIDVMVCNTKELADTLIIKGDIANDNSYSKEFLIMASSIWENVWHIDGNHYYYFQNKNIGDNRLYKLIDDLKDYQNIKYVANTVQELNSNGKLLKIGFLPLMYNVNNPIVRDMFNYKMNDKYFINENYVYNSYEKGYSFYENNIYGKCDVCVSHVPTLRLRETDGKETTYYTKLKPDPNITYIFGHTHENERVVNYIKQEDGSKKQVIGYNIGVGYPYDRGIGIPHTQTFKWSSEKNKLVLIENKLK